MSRAWYLLLIAAWLVLAVYLLLDFDPSVTCSNTQPC